MNIDQMKEKDTAEGYRPLNQAEVGPDWYPKKAVEDLREACTKLNRTISIRDVERGDGDSVPVSLIALEEWENSLIAFDAAIEGEK